MQAQSTGPWKSCCPYALVLWSPNSRYLAYLKLGTNTFETLVVWDSQTNRTRILTHRSSGIFMSDSTNFAPPEEAERRARAIVRATTHFDDPKILLETSEECTGAMKGLAVSAMSETDMMQKRGW